MNVLVTNERIENNSSDYEVMDFNAFYNAATSDVGLNISGDLYIDVNSLPPGEEQQTYESLNSAGGADVIWFTVDSKNPPIWFNGELAPCPIGGSDSPMDDATAAELAGALDILDTDINQTDDGDTIGRIITFGSAKGGSGKTFTSIITAVYYAKDHPNEKVCLFDLDVEEPQVGAAIKKLGPTVKKFYEDYLNGDTGFEYMERCKVNIDRMPKNLDFYLSPRGLHPIKDNDFWEQCMTNLFLNYDLVVLDTGTTYMQVPAIASAYKVADKINIVTMANLPSSVAISDQIKRLTGETQNDVYSREDGLENKINLIITNARENAICNTIIKRMAQEAPICAKFGDLVDKINRCQILSEWDIFDNNAGFREGIRDIYS